jgi:hypothetical protein
MKVSKTEYYLVHSLVAIPAIAGIVNLIYPSLITSELKKIFVFVLIIGLLWAVYRKIGINRN